MTTPEPERPPVHPMPDVLLPVPPDAEPMPTPLVPPAELAPRPPEVL